MDAVNCTCNHLTKFAVLVVSIFVHQIKCNTDIDIGITEREVGQWNNFVDTFCIIRISASDITSCNFLWRRFCTRRKGEMRRWVDHRTRLRSHGSISAGLESLASERS